MKKTKRSTTRKSSRKSKNSSSKLILFLFGVLAVCAVIYAYPRVVTAVKSIERPSLPVIQKDITGNYVGTLPCADCPGIETILTLRSDMTYELVETYQDRDAVFTSGGHWSYSNENFRVILQEAERQFLIRGDSLEMLDMNGDQIQSKFNLKLKKIQ